MIVYHILVLVVLLLCSSVLGQGITAPVELYTSDNVVNPGEVHGILANLNCSSFTKAIIQVAVNLPNFIDKSSQAVMYLSLTPVTIGNNQPFPDPNYPSSYKYTTYNGLNTPLPGVTFSGQGVTILYIAVVCFNPPCEYNLAITEASSSSAIITAPSSSSIMKADTEGKPAVVVGVPTLTENTKKDLDQVVVKRLMLRNRINLNGSVNWNTWAPTTTIPICANTLSNIYGPNAMVCFESSVVGTSIGFLFYQQLSVIPNQSEFAPKWFVRPINTKEHIRDLTGTFKLPVNRYRTLPIPISLLLQVDQVYNNILGWGGEGVNPPNTNYYIVFYEWFECTD